MMPTFGQIDLDHINNLTTAFFQNTKYGHMDKNELTRAEGGVQY